MTTTTIIVKDVALRLNGKKILDGISFELPANQHLLITGASGSGKTMLTKALSGNLFHEGRISFSEKGATASPFIIRVDQHYHFTNRSHVNQFYYQQRFNSMDADDSATIREELDEPDQDAELNKLLVMFEMEHRLDTPLLHLSSGEHKRFQLIKALLQHPTVLVLDEPFTGMDIRSRMLLRSLLEEKCSKGCTLILVCDEAECPAFIERALLLDAGMVAYYGERKNMPAGAIGSVSSTPYLQPALLAPLEHRFESIVEMKDTAISYGDRVLLQNINWTVNNGEKWWLKGINGSGKSTLISLITGDNPKAYCNTLSLFGRKRGTGESIWDIKRNIGYVSPELQWYFEHNMTCYQAIASGLFDTIGLFRQLNESQHAEVMKWSNWFGLSDVNNKPLNMLSTGQQRLALLARAIIKNPHLLVLDEPCQGLDERQRNSFVSMVEHLCGDPNRTLIYVTHYEEELPSCIHKKIELVNGIATIETYYPEKLLSA